MSETPNAPTAPTSSAAPVDEREDQGRRLFRYLGGDEWREYRAIMAVFAGTFFSEFTPEDVQAALGARADDVDPTVVADRLESLRRWGNLTVSTSIGNPTSIADYYRRRNRYLITRAGQEVHDLVEGVLARVDEVRDVSTGRLRVLLEALRTLAAHDIAVIDPVTLGDLVGAVFDPHQVFTAEITQFFAAINQWQSRYDLSPDEFRFFAEVLVGYVAERLDEIERTARPIGHVLDELAPRFALIVERAHLGLATRVAQAGLDDSVSVTRRAGATIADWDHLAGWFVSRRGRPSRIEQLGREAVAAIRTLTLNLARLSRVGVGASSRRADFLRIARWFHDATPEQLPQLVVAAFGLHPTTHWGVLADDAGDPVTTSTPWRDAPRAVVPVSLRERGDTTNRGRASPLRDRALEERVLRQRRAAELDAARQVDEELLAGPLAGRTLSGPAMARLQRVLARAMTGLGVEHLGASVDDGALRCIVQRRVEADLAIASVDGTLTLCRLHVTIEPVGTVETTAFEMIVDGATAFEATAFEITGEWGSGS